MEPFGWDKEDRVYFVLDDNRLYRRTDAPPPPDVAPKTPTKAKTKARKSNGRNTRSAKKPRIGRRVIETSPEETEEEHEVANGVEEEEPAQDDFHMQRWELLAVSMDEYNEFIDSIRKSRDPNEKDLVKNIQAHVMPILAEAEEERKRKEVRRMKELELLQKMATSKRSSRLADKQDKIRADREAAEQEAAHKAELEMAHKEQKRQQQMEEARESRRETREQRLKEREVKRILEQERLEKEQELLQKMETDGSLIDTERGRISERQLKADMEKRKRDLAQLQPDDSWYFDCVCGVHGQDLDDGSHSIACEKCSTWQHSKCNGISEQQAERDDFHFICQDCKKKAENPEAFKIKLKVAQSPKPAAEKAAKAAKVGRPPKAKGEASATASSPARTPKASKMNGTAPMVYPGAPPAPPSQNGAPHANGASPTQYQWHAYQPPANYSPSYTGYAGYQSQFAQQAARAAAGPSSPVATFNHQTPATYAQSYSPPRQPATYAPRAPTQSPRPPQPQYQAPVLAPQQAPYQQPPPGAHSPSAPRLPQPPQLPPANALPPMQANGPPPPTSPTKRPISSGFGPIIPPPLIKSPATNGTHQHPPQERPTSSHAPPTTTPAPAPRAPVFTPTSSFSSSAQGGSTPFNAAPGFSPTKHESPKVGASSPHLPPAAVAASPPNTAAAHFVQPKQAAGISPVKHDASSPQQAPVAPLSAGLGGVPAPVLPPAGNKEKKVEQAVAGAPAAELVNPVLAAPQILPTPPKLPGAEQNGS
jgi:hypothetical protein